MKSDLNLLLVFDAVARFGSVSRAAQHLSLSQPAVSHALNRLRVATGDPLFTRAGRGLVPTPRATEMMVPVRGLVGTAETMFSPRHFDPTVETQVFRIGASDYAAFTLMPHIMSRLERTAPNVTVEVFPAGGQILDLLTLGRLDLSFWGTDAPTVPHLYHQLTTERYVGVARADHPIFADAGPTLAGYLSYAHAVVSLQSPGINVIDRVLGDAGLTRRVGLVSHSFAGNLATLPHCDLIASLPSRLCWRLDARLRQFDLPISVPSYPYGMVWHPRTDSLASHIWLRGNIAEALRDAEETATRQEPP